MDQFFTGPLVDQSPSISEKFSVREFRSVLLTLVRNNSGWQDPERPTHKVGWYKVGQGFGSGPKKRKKFKLIRICTDYNYENLQLTFLENATGYQLTFGRALGDNYCPSYHLKVIDRNCQMVNVPRHEWYDILIIWQRLLSPTTAFELGEELVPEKAVCA